MRLLAVSFMVALDLLLAQKSQHVCRAGDTCGHALLQTARVRFRTLDMESPKAEFSFGTPAYPHDLMPCEGGAVLQTKCMTTEQYLAVAKSVRNLYDGLNKTCEGLECPQGDFAGCVLRMAGHDFMDFNPEGKQKGGADGCINFADKDNKGLEPCLYEGEFGVALSMAYSEHCATVSLADFLVIAGEEVIRATTVRANPIDFMSHFKFGRTTSTSCEWNIALPDAEESCPAVKDSFIDRMGLTWRTSAALMGAHALGRAQAKNSGYDGLWTLNMRAFDNAYYANMVAKGWMPKKQMGIGKKNKKKWENSWGLLSKVENLTKVQWARSDDHGANLLGPELMLNTDICLIYNNGYNEPVSAKRDKCCAWKDPKLPSFRELNPKIDDDYVLQIAKNTDDQSYCGIPWREIDDAIPQDHRTPMKFAHKACCAGAKPESCANCQKRRQQPCTETPEQQGLRLQGPAAADVIEFARYEHIWMEEFLNAWTIVTENGHEGLKSLQQTCS